MARVKLDGAQLRKIQESILEMLLEVDRLCRKHSIRYSLAYGTLLGAVRHKGFIPWDDDVDIWIPRKDLIKFKKICETELDSRFFYQSKKTDKEYYLLFDKIRLNGTIFKEDYYEEYDIHHGLYIDIFPIDNIPDNPIADKWRILAYEFCRLGIQSRYLKADAREGKKRILAKILSKLYAPFSLDFLFQNAEKIAVKYLDTSYKRVSNIFDPDKSHVFETRYFENFIDVEFCGYKMKICADYDAILNMRYGEYMKLPPEDERIPHHNLTELQI